MNPMDLIILFTAKGLLSQNPDVIISFFFLYCFCTSVLGTDTPQKILTRSHGSVLFSVCTGRELAKGVTPCLKQNSKSRGGRLLSQGRDR